MSKNIEKDAISGVETTGHQWDGIKELDTPLPRWWLYTLYATILFAVVYCVLFPSIPWPWGGHSVGLLNWTSRNALEDEIKTKAVATRPQYVQIAKLDLDAIDKDPSLKAFAVSGGRSAFAQNCAPCHGGGGQGARGYPNLLDDVWLWGGTLPQIYQTVQFGVRNSNPESHQGASMPAWGDESKAPPQVLDVGQIDALADYLLLLNHQTADAAAAKAGEQLFADNCVACHGEKAEGNQDVGAPPLTAGVWLYGGDKATLIETITHGRAGQMPAWSERLDPATVKMLALYVHQMGGGK